MSRRAKPPGWYEDFPHRLLFERAAREVFPAMTSRRVGRGAKAVVVYELTVPVPDHEDRHLTIEIADLTEPVMMRILTDGPADSPHRYSDGGLCMWHPSTPGSERWVPADGLLSLIRYAQLHCYREGHFRRTGEWLGSEVPHGPAKEAA